MKKRKTVSSTTEKDRLKNLTEKSSIFKGRHECIGCTYHVKQTSAFKQHLNDRNCEHVKICDLCGVFRSLSGEMLQKHREYCTGKVKDDDEEDKDEDE